MSNLLPFLSAHGAVLLVLLLTVLADFLVCCLLRYLEGRAGRRVEGAKFSGWRKQLRLPLRLLIWVLGLSWMGQYVWQPAEEGLRLLSLGRRVALLLALGWFLLRMTHFAALLLERYYAARLELSQDTVHFLSNFVKLLVISLLILIIMQNIGINITAILTLGGVGGIVIGLAARATFANLFGGLMLFLDKPFVTGDMIASSERQLEGTVEHVAWRRTTVRTFSGTLLYVPNSLFQEIVLENPSRRTNRRIKEVIGIRYQDLGRLQDILKELGDMLQKHDELDQNKLHIACFTSFAPSSLDIMLYCFTRRTDWTSYHTIKQDVLLKAEAIIHRHQAEIAYPTRRLFLSQTPPDEDAPRA